MGLAKKDHVRQHAETPEVAAAWREVHGAAPGEAEAEAVMAALREPMLRVAEECAVLIPGAAATVRSCGTPG